MTAYTINVHVADDTPIAAQFLNCGSGDFASLQIGESYIFLRGDNVERLAGVLNDYIAARATPGSAVYLPVAA